MGGVRTSIIGRPRPLPANDAPPTRERSPPGGYTLNCEEPRIRSRRLCEEDSTEELG